MFVDSVGRRVGTFTLQEYKLVIESAPAVNLIFNLGYVQAKNSRWLDCLNLSSI